MAGGSKLHRMAQERLRKLNAENRERQAVVTEESGSSIKTTATKLKTESGLNEPKPKPKNNFAPGPLAKARALRMGGAKLTREELAALKREAVIREREKRRKQRLEQEANEQANLAAAKREAVRRESVRRESVRSTTQPSRPSSIATAPSTNVALQPPPTRKRRETLNAEEIKRYKDQATAREAERERLRKKASALEQEKERVRQEALDSYKQLALAREYEMQRRKDKARRLKRTESIESRLELEAAFAKATASRGGVFGVQEAERFVEEHSRYTLKPSLRKLGLRVVSWVTLEEHLASPKDSDIEKGSAGPSGVATVSRRSLERRVRDVLALCEASFCELERHSGFPGKVRPSDLSALHLSRDFQSAHPLPSISVSSDAPWSWKRYKSWIIKSISEELPGAQDALRDVQVNVGIDRPHNQSPGLGDRETAEVRNGERTSHHGKQGDDSHFRETRKQGHAPRVSQRLQRNRDSATAHKSLAASSASSTSTESSAASSPANIAAQTSHHKEDLRVLDAHIGKLESRLATIDGAAARDPGSSEGSSISSPRHNSSCSSGSSSSSSNESRECSSESEGEAMDVNRNRRRKTKRRGKKLSSRHPKNRAEKESETSSVAATDSDKSESGEDDDRIVFSGRCWMLCERMREDWLAADQEWERSREVCAEVEVTQVNEPFRLYVRVHLMRSGLQCTRRLGVAELAALTAQFAKHAEKQRVALSQSGHHVLAQGKRCRSLGPDAWTREELEAAIRAESSMRDWVEAGQMPRRNDLVRWVLLHCTVRISGDELDPEDGHVHLVLPGDEALLEDEAWGVAAENETRKSKTTRDDADADAKPKASESRLSDVALDRLNRVDPDERSKLVSKARRKLDTLDAGVPEVLHWLEAKSAKKLGKTYMQKILDPELSIKEVRSLFSKEQRTALAALFRIVDTESIHKEWTKRVKGLLVADLFDLFRTHESIGGEAGVVTADTFVGLLQDTLLMRTPTWALVVLHGKFPRYREFLRHMFHADRLLDGPSSSSSSSLSSSSRAEVVER